MTPNRIFRFSRIAMVACAVVLAMTTAVDLRYGLRIQAGIDIALIVANLGWLILVTIRWHTFEGKQALRDSKLGILNTQLETVKAQCDIAKLMLKKAIDGEAHIHMGMPDDEDAPRH